MQPSSPEPKRCRVCGAELQPEHRYCPNCGTQVAPPSAPGTDVIGPEPTVIHHQEPDPDPSTLETREIPLNDVPAAPAEPDVTPAPEWAPSSTAVPPESGNRTLWIILVIIAAIVLICCCLLPLALFTVASVDTAFQDEIRSLAVRTRL